MSSPNAIGQPGPDPHRCPECGWVLSNAGGVAACGRCGFNASHPLAGRVWEIDNEFGRLGAERAGLIEQMRRDRQAAPVSGGIVAPHGGAAGVATPAARRPRRNLTAQTMLVGLGAFLVIVAGIVFAAVTWDRLGAAGQAAVLAVATAVAVATTLAAARAHLTSTAEALSVVAAGFALIDVHAVRVAVTPEGDWQWVWAIGLAVVAGGLVALGRLGSLRAPPLIGVFAAQLPVALMASVSDRAGPAIATALLATAIGDMVAQHVVRRERLAAFPDPIPAIMALLGAATWALAVMFALPSAFGDRGIDITDAERWWGVAVLAGAAAGAAGLSWRRTPRDLLGGAAAASSVLVALAAVLAAAGALIDDGDTLLLVANAVGLLVLAGSLPFMGAGSDTSPAESESPGVDQRIRIGQMAATSWTALSVLGWVEPVMAALAAPFAEIADRGWWTQPLSVTTGDLGLDAVNTPSLRDGPPIGFVLMAVTIATATMAAAIWAFATSPGARRRGVAVAAGIGVYTAVAVSGAHWDVPVIAVMSAYLLATAALALGPVRPGGRYQPWVALAAVPTAAAALAWAANVDILTVVVLGLMALVGSAATAGGLVDRHRTWTAVASLVAGTALPATVLAFALAAGASDQAAWIATVAAAAATTGLAWVGDEWCPWWSPMVEAVGVLTTACGMVGLAAVATADGFSVGLAIVSVAAAAHVARPHRRVIAATISGIAALLVLWLQLWHGEVRLVEAYSLPAAALLGLAGWWQMRRDPTTGSWPALGPALVVAAMPSAVVAIVEPDAIRPMAVLGVAVAVTIAGATGRLRSPLVVGSVTAVVMALDQISPVVARLPRWIGIGAAGILLLAVGATFERQRKRVTEAYSRYRTLK